MRLAMVTPLDPRSSGVADYSLDLLPHLAAIAGEPIAVFTSEAEPQSGLGWSSHPIDQLRDRVDRFDLLVYQMGNSPAHDFMADDVFEHPGLVVLHDLSLHNFFARQAQAGRVSRYLRALGYGYGLAGVALGRRVQREPVPVNYPDYLVSEWLAARSPGVIVHSQHAQQVLSARCPTARLFRIPMPIPLPPFVSRAEARRQLGLAPDMYLLGVFGVLNNSKNPTAILDTLARLAANEVPAHVVFIGRENDTFLLAAETARRGLDDRVISLGFVDNLSIVNLWMAAVDVALGLRSLYWGETPSSTLRLLAAGLPVIINDIGAFAELPDAACVKIAPNDPNVANTLYLILRNLCWDQERRRLMGRAARDYIVREHDPDQVARHYVAAAKALVGGA